ncbi:GIY-YIG nuclease family protein [Cyclobacterium plantarum]|uniref:GIY-YIG nuclease family protein n=1 Tax=Cyclobacterium plantarum TaxID=2716263 RepID=A0ABX0H8E0_9BACT|nr:GIY-YIG nuclease family protein [Cyclobacterium plantarum]NHE56491.1 GIY-YIG nuclease family protein [Cyclobacterium plantarum]
MTHYIYILESESDGSFYIGSSQDPVERLSKHNRPHKGYTARKQPWKLVHTEAFETKAEAISREKYLKKLKSRKLVISLIERVTK